MALKKFEPQREPLVKKITGDYDKRLPYNTNAYDTELSYDKFDTAKTEFINPKNTKPLRPDDTTIDDHQSEEYISTKRTYEREKEPDVRKDFFQPLKFKTIQGGEKYKNLPSYDYRNQQKDRELDLIDEKCWTGQIQKG